MSEEEEKEEEEEIDWKEICIGRSSWKERFCRGIVWKNSLVILSSTSNNLLKEVNFLTFSSSFGNLLIFFFTMTYNGYKVKIKFYTFN